MTLDISRYLENLVKKEAKVSHFSVNVSAGKMTKLTPDIKMAIALEYGDSYLQDANYLVFFIKSEGWASTDKKKLFDLTNRALGKDANGMTESDFKELPSLDDDLPAEDADEETTAEKSNAEEGTMTTLFMKVTIK